jgi:hypothetical protein
MLSCRQALVAATLLGASLCSVSGFSPGAVIGLRPSLRSTTCDVSMAKAKRPSTGGGFGAGTNTLERPKPKKTEAKKKATKRVGGNSVTKKKGGDDLFAMIDSVAKAPSSTTVSTYRTVQLATFSSRECLESVICVGPDLLLFV